MFRSVSQQLPVVPLVALWLTISTIPTATAADGPSRRAAADQPRVYSSQNSSFNRLQGEPVWIVEVQQTPGSPWSTYGTYPSEKEARNRLHFLVERGAYHRVRVRRSVRYHLASRPEMVQAAIGNRSTSSRSQPNRSLSPAGGSAIGNLQPRNPLPQVKQGPTRQTTSQQGASAQRGTSSGPAARAMQISPISSTAAPSSSPSVRSGDGEASDPTRIRNQGLLVSATRPATPTGPAQPQLDPFRGVRGSLGSGLVTKYLLELGQVRYGSHYQRRIEWTEAGLFDTHEEAEAAGQQSGQRYRVTAVHPAPRPGGRP